MSRSLYRRYLAQYGQYAVGLAALLWLLIQLDWRRTSSFLEGLSPGTAIVLVVVSVAGQFCIFLSWHVLFHKFRPTRFVEAGSVTLSLAFFNLSLPSRLPSTMLNPLLVTYNTALDGGESTAVSIVHTTLYAGCYGLVTLLGLAVGFDWFPTPLLLVLGLAAAIYGAVVLAGLGLGSGLTHVDAILHRLVGLPIVGSLVESALSGETSLTDEIKEAAKKCLKDRKLIVVYGLAWTGGILLASGVRIGILFGAAGVTFPSLLLLPVFSVTAYAITVLPISVGGIGVAEVSATLVFTSLGVPLEVVAPVVLIDRFFGGYLPGLLGVYPAIETDLSSIQEG